MSKNFVAGGTIRRARFCKLSTTENHTVLEADANERTIGVAMLGSRETPLPAVTANPPEAAQDGDHLQVHTENSDREDIVLEIGTGGCTAGDMLKSDADGKGVTAAASGTTVQWVGAIALEAASAGELAKVALTLFPYRPALS